MKFEYSKKTGKMEMIKDDDSQSYAPWSIAKNRCFIMLDTIEDKTKIMAHENEKIMNEFKDWMDGKIKDVYFLNFLNRYFDEINN
jgi:predicted DNA-binding protein (MmcQ/YjbR family)